MGILSWLKNNFTKADEVAQTGYKDSNSHPYHHTIDMVDTWLKQETEVEEKVLLLDFVMKAIRKDLQYDTLTTLLYSKEHFDKRWPLLLLPLSYYDEEGREYETNSDEERSHEVQKTPYDVEVHDFRFAILYTLAQKKYYLNNESTI